MWANDDCSDSRWSEEGQPSVRLGQAHISLMNGGIGLRHDAISLMNGGIGLRHDAISLIDGG